MENTSTVAGPTGSRVGGPLDGTTATNQPHAHVARNAGGRVAGFYAWDGMYDCFRFVSGTDVRSGTIGSDTQYVSDTYLAAGFEAYLEAVGQDMAAGR